MVRRDDPSDPYITWHVSAKYDTALDDRSIPGGYTVDPDRMTPEQRTAWERWHMYGTPVELEGDVVGNVHIDLPGGLGGTLPEGDQVLRIGPAVGDFDGEPAGRALWVIEDADGTSLAERLFTFRLKGRGLGVASTATGSMPTGIRQSTSSRGRAVWRNGRCSCNSMPRRTLGGRTLCSASDLPCGSPLRGRAGNQLRPRDEFSLNVSTQALPLSGESPVPMAAVEAVEDLIRISAAIRRSIGSPGQHYRARSAERRRAANHCGHRLRPRTTSWHRRTDRLPRGRPSSGR